MDAANATSTSPEVLKIRGASKSRLLAPGRVAHLPGDVPPVVLRARVICPIQWRGRTGIKPVSVAPLAIDCVGSLRAPERACKRKDHRTAKNNCKRDHVARIDVASTAECRKIDDRNGIGRYIGR